MLWIGHGHDFLLEEVPAVAHDELGTILIDTGSAYLPVSDGPLADAAFNCEEIVLVLHLVIFIRRDFPPGAFSLPGRGGNRKGYK